MNFSIGDKIGGRFEIHKILGGAGRSGMGIVYLCYDHKNNTVLALKTYQEGYFNDKILVNHFKKGALAWIQLEKHPNIVQAYNVSKLGEQLFINLEYIAPDELNRNTITHYLQYKIALKRLLLWCIHFCDAMEYARSRGVTPHRDIKPDNLMVSSQGILKITDFDLSGKSQGSQLYEIASQAQKNAQPGLTFIVDDVNGTGTQAWMAPEQFAGHSSAQSDLYSFGIVLYQLASGKHPIVVDDYQNWEQAHRQTLVKEINHELWPLIRRCLAKDPLGRLGGNEPDHCFIEMREHVVQLWQQFFPNQEIPEPASGVELEAGELNDKGVSLSSLGLQQQALKAYQQSLKLKPDYAPTYLNAGVAYANKGDMSNAIKAYKKAIKLDPGLAAAYHNYALIFKDKSRLDEAEKLFRKALSLDPHAHNSAEQLGIILSETGRHEQAIEFINKAIEYDPLHAGFHYTMGVALEKAKQHQKSLQYYLEAVRLNPDSAVYFYGLGNGYRFMGDIQQAVNCWKRTLELDFQHESVRFNLGLAFEQANDIETAYHYYHESTEIAPKFANSYYNLGLMLANNHLFGEGAEAFDNFVRYAQNNPQLASHIDTAKSYIVSMEKDEQMTQEQMIYPQAVYNRGLSLLNLGRLDEAKQWFDKSIQMEPNSAKTLCGLGIYFERLKDYQQAIQYYQHALKIDPSYTIAWNNLGWAQYLKQDFAASRTCYQKFIEVGMDFPEWVERARQMIASMDEAEGR